MKITRTIALALLFLAVYWTYKSLTPSYMGRSDLQASAFSTDRALVHVKKIAEKPHAVGFTAHNKVRDYVTQELKGMGLNPTHQEGYSLGDGRNLCRPSNILAKIKGSSNGKALLLMSHYDSHPHSSYGASDAGSGVATILEGVRAFLSKNQTPKNDIIVLITDGEEVGLNGAELFVKEHPWAKDVGLVLNFEARGSGGPSYMLIETNRGNQQLINEFVKANPEYPVGNSLAYSIYKMLPNDTDLTVFRKDRDIDGFNFAFIDDHYDYHTALDIYKRLDPESLAHQGSYLMPLLEHFANADLGNVKSLNDNVYFNVPFFKLIHYPYDWIWPMYFLAVLAFIVLLWHGFKAKKLQLNEVFKGFLPMLGSLLLSLLFGYVLWPILTWWYPPFNDLLHGFPYAGHDYIAATSLLSFAFCLLAYREFYKIKTKNLLVAPIFLWLVICTLLNLYLKGASFFILPLFALLVGFMVCMNQESPNPFLLAFLAIPAIAIFAPFIAMFPVGLGFQMLMAATLFTVFLFLFSLPFFGTFIPKRRLAALALLIFFFYSLKAHLKSRFDAGRPKPTSLVYMLDADKKSGHWLTYDHVLTEWNGPFLEKENLVAPPEDLRVPTSKYGTVFRLMATAPKKDIKIPDLHIELDTIIGESHLLKVCAIPNRLVNRLDVFTNSVTLEKAKVNGIELSEHDLASRKNHLITHFITDNDNTELELQFSKDDRLELTFYESSNDLLHNPMFSVPERPNDEIPMPFVLNDAILVTKTLVFEY